MPLRDLDGASAQYDSDDTSHLGGGGGGGSPDPGACGLGCTQSGCGDGIKQAGESCDSAGVSDACGSDCQPTACAANCYCFSERGSNYMLCTQPWLYWLDAEAACEDNGMQLVQVGSAWENGFVGFRTYKANSSDTWLGATDAAQEGVWRWMDETNFWVGGNAGEARNGAFIAWQPTEPNNSVNNAENCMRLAEGTLWHDEICDHKRVFMCETRWPSSTNCGNGTLDDGEVCDARGFSAECDNDCTRARCGDGVVNTLAGEQCDDGNHDSLDACDGKCRTTALVGFWPLLERTGAWATDLSDTGAPAALSNCTFGDQVGLSLNDGVSDIPSSDDYLQIPTRAALAFTGHYTLSLHALPTGTPTSVQTLLFRGGANDEALFLRLNNNWLQGGSIVTSSTDEYLINGDVTLSFGAGTWSHFALTYDGSAYRLYANGSEIGSQTTPVRDPVAGQMGWRIGSQPGGNDYAFHGKLANVRIYARALSAAEVEELATVTP